MTALLEQMAEALRRHSTRCLHEREPGCDPGPSEFRCRNCLVREALAAYEASKAKHSPGDCPTIDRGCFNCAPPPAAKPECPECGGSGRTYCRHETCGGNCVPCPLGCKVKP